MTIDETQDQIIAEMADFNDLLDTYDYLIRLGDSMSQPDETLHQEENRVGDCQSQVWIRTRLENGRLHIEADSDARITRGIIALVVRILNEHDPCDILEANLFILENGGLSRKFSPVRNNGLRAILKRILSDAKRHCNSDHTD